MDSSKGEYVVSNITCFIGICIVLFSFFLGAIHFFFPTDHQIESKREKEQREREAAEREVREREERERKQREWEVAEAGRRVEAVKKQLEEEQRRAREAEAARLALQNARSKPPEDW
ncbi:MAG: hypothetical protein QM758_13470 [Armatimonas sp.]